MVVAEYKNRFLRALPGRLRIEICGLKENKQTAERVVRTFSGVTGVLHVDPCTSSGRLLLVYDELRISLEDILQRIQAFENDDSASPPETECAYQQTAAAVETEAPVIPESIKTMQVMQKNEQPAREKVPLPLALSMGGLAVLGMKQLFAGKSALAQSPMPFYLSGLVSVVTGYPFLRRGFESYVRDKKWNADLILGTGALSLALVRENLVVLAGLSILQYVNWKRSRDMPDIPCRSEISQEMRSYSEKAGKAGMIAAGAAWAVTRNPLRGIAVLLAANPRPATMPAEFAWRQAEVVSAERHYVVPENGSLSGLAGTETMLIEDSALLFDHRIRPVECMADEEDADKVVCLAASLMEKSGHPWKEEVRELAKQTCRTLRTAFHVEEEAGGMKGRINDFCVYAGDADYMQRHGIDCESVMLEAKRLKRKGCSVLFVASQAEHAGRCLGLLAKEPEWTAKYQTELLALVQRGWNVALLRDRVGLETSSSHRLDGLDTSWLSLQEGEIIERIAVKRQQGENVLFAAGSERTPLNEVLNEAGVPSVSIQELGKVVETADYAKRIGDTVDQHFQITKRWNAFGSAMASLGLLTAPIVNLAADALSLAFLSRSKKISESPVSPADGKGNREVAAAAEETPLSWHSMPWDRVAGHFQADRHHGLTAEQIRLAQSKYGLNCLENKKPAPWLVSYLGQFKEFTTLVLLGTSVLALFTGGIFDGLAMGAVLLANAAIGTVQERKAEKTVEALNQYQPPRCRAIREGQQAELTAVELVPGDIVCLEAGDRVPADMRLIRSWNLEVSEAALTGESLPVAKHEDAVAEASPLSERKNMLYMGSDVCRGKAVGVVVQTGMETEMGHLMHLLKKNGTEETPLQEKVTSISKKFLKGALIAGGIVFVTGLLRGIPFAQMITTSITLAASAIPEGLPVVITIALSAGIFRMATKNALIRKLSALETLGRTTVICTDKTGTLTKNEMTVKTVVSVDRLWSVTGNGYEPEGEIEDMSSEAAAGAAVEAADDTGEETEGGPAQQPELLRMMQIGVLCNNSTLERQKDRWTVKGDPTEGALLTLAAKKGLWKENMSRWHRGAEVPFDSNTAKMSVVCRDTEADRECYVFSKGAVETILRHCTLYQTNGEVCPLTDEMKREIAAQNEKLSGDALRVLAFAYRPVEPGENQDGIDEKEMIYVGMVGMMDPPKSDVERSVREASGLGVKPVMITGDHPITAVAVAKQLGIYDGEQKVLSGHELERLTDDELYHIVDGVSIFARVTPEHKLRIVKALQQRGHIVAMTGDGINDTPAIKQADVGIAMGRTGTEVTKETADMVLKEDHFGSIVDGVKEGRTIIGNIRKAIGCLLSGNLAEIIVTSVAVMMGLPIPLVPIQILLMNLLTDSVPAVVLAVNPGNKNKSSRRTDIVDKDLYRKVAVRGVLLGVGSLGLFAATIAAGAPVAVAQTVAFATLVTGQLLQTFSWRREGTEETVRDWTKDRFLIGALGVSWLALLAALYVPPVAGFFHTVPLSLTQWLPILLTAGSVTLLTKPVLALLSRDEDKPQQRPAVPGGQAVYA